MLRSFLIVALAGLLGSCSSGGGGWRERPHELPEALLPAEAAVTCPPAGDGDGRAPISVAMTGDVLPSRAPLPASEAERHVFAGLYETLVRLDCDGAARPGLARRWTAYDGGRVWRFELRPAARFWDGTPADATAVIASWRRSVALCRLRGEPDPFLRFDPRGDAVAILDRDELLIRLRTPSDNLPLDLAHPALAVVGDSDGRGWLAGSGPCRPEGSPRGGELTLLPAAEHPRGPSWPRLEILLIGEGTDARDLLDTGLHAVVDRSRRVHDYYAGRRLVDVLELPWDRWYYLIAPEADRRWTTGWEQRVLAREIGDALAAPADFSAYEPPPGLCTTLRAATPSLVPPPLPETEDRPASDENLILWPADDPEAGALAERLATVAARPIRDDDIPGRGPLARPPEPSPGDRPTALAVDPSALGAHVQQDPIGAAVVPWPRRFARPCDELARLLSLAAWLQAIALDGDAATEAVPPGARPAQFTDAAAPGSALAAMRRLERERVVQPLVRTRAFVAARPSIEGWDWNLDGSLRLERLGRQD
ncbi:hypothetical protein GF314_02475 [bacterium]|nr:hypothetical protein [bacterium]